MKKTVLAFAVAAAVGVPAAAAADTTLYGRLNVSLDFVDDGVDSSHQLASNSSRLGVRGSEDLGIAGLKGVYQMEAGFDAAQGGGGLATRNTYLGLAGGFGELRLGRHDTPYKTATLPLNFFADTLGDKHHMASRWAAVGAGTDSTFYQRPDNTIVYMSPDLDGLRFMASYTTDRDNDTPSAVANDQNSFSLAATFTQGPMFVTVAYEQQNDVDYAFSGVNEVEDAKAWKVGGTYQIQDLTLAAMYENLDTGTNLWGDRDVFHIGAKYQLGQAYVMGSYTNAGELDVDDTDAQMFALGAGYDFTRRTSMYAVYARTNNEDAGMYGLAGSGKGKGVEPGAIGENVAGFQLGVTHNF
ncbi:porin [Ectothiorhodospira haloalkaliphila]|uniref:porin n=1 Tax=Ectothiorhodospira haloalkaliphila TaxID=421628 RepID=UPI001EE86BBF|nr:porin [Ectothiorhodospira haloalkaliphila]MCG5523916.1 porin [Ectothiorhodospira haloalkaliphila]